MAKPAMMALHPREGKEEQMIFHRPFSGAPSVALIFAAAAVTFAVFLPALLTAGDSRAGEAPVRSYPNQELLISPQALAQRIKEPGLVVVDARSKSRYLLGHIDGAVHIDGGCGGPLVEDRDEAPCMLVPAEKGAAVFAASGVTLGKEVVVYGDEASWGAEGRIFWILEMLGHRHARLLDGGFPEWRRLGLPIGRWPTKAEPASGFGAPARYDPTLASTTGEIARSVGSEGFYILDNRTAEEYKGAILYGEVRGGHIPGSTLLPWTDFLGDGYRFKSAVEIEALLRARGIPVGQSSRHDVKIVALCTGGIRSGFGYFAMRLIGYKKVSNYDGSWWAWAKRADLPAEK